MISSRPCVPVGGISSPLRPRRSSIQALPGIIDDLKKQGYSFVTIDELCEMGGVPKAAQGED